MKSTQLIVLGVALSAAVGAGYLAMHMQAPPPVAVEAAAVPVAPQIVLDQVLVTGDRKSVV